jgi:division protein CdvB (Snf7/Vps24/ESCRT-III family)
MKLQTVNVIEFFNETIQNVTSFSDDAEGNKEAETLFSKIATENGFSGDDIEAGLDDGYLDRPSDDYNLFITHSNPDS